MQAITKLNRWANAHTNVFTDTLRVMFGVFLFYKGLKFIEDTDYLYTLLRTVSGKGSYLVLVHYVALAHLCGGVFIVLGLVTRLAALVNAPTLVGAVTVNFIGAMNHVNLLQSLIAFFACAFFILYGSGKHSVDKVLRLHV